MKIIGEPQATIWSIVDQQKTGETDKISLRIKNRQLVGPLSRPPSSLARVPQEGGGAVAGVGMEISKFTVPKFSGFKDPNFNASKLHRFHIQKIEIPNVSRSKTLDAHTFHNFQVLRFWHFKNVMFAKRVGSSVFSFKVRLHRMKGTKVRQIVKLCLIAVLKS